MGKSLVIVESPAKAKTIHKILGPDYVVRACMGHIRDLPQKDFGVDIEKDFQPKYEIMKGKKKVVSELKAAAKGVDDIYLAPDPDREGEAIAWHLQHLLSGTVSDEHFHRVTYQEITASAIRRAFQETRNIDQHKVDAQQARRILDRLVGYRVSPLLWRRVKGGSSAGRVQSVALRLVCERETEIRNFVPEEFWIIGAEVQKQVEPATPFYIKLAKIDDQKAEIKNTEQAEKVKADLENSTLRVADVNRREINKRPQPPFITSTLQQAGNSAYSFTPSRTMRIAQRLYEGADLGEGTTGLITYMRTDSVAISKEAQAACRQYVENRFGSPYVPSAPHVFKSRGSAQEAHEAIRPTDVNRTPESLKEVLSTEEFKLYKLIWERFVASQMSAARIAQRTVEIEASAQSRYLFRASASEVVFPGYMKVTGLEKKKKKKAEEDALSEEAETLPEVEKGEDLNLLDWISEQKFTQPPSRYSESALVRALEENGVGRPSTYAAILSTLYDRKYIEREKRTVHPTELGENVNSFLVEHLNELFNVTFTAEMEENLDRVEKGSEEWVSMLRNFYEHFEKWLKGARGPAADNKTVDELLNGLKAVKEWEPPVKRGNRSYSDEKFVESIRKQQEDGGRELSKRQEDALKKMAVKYLSQLPELQQHAERLGLHAFEKQVQKEQQPPRDSSIHKLNLLNGVTFDEPRKVGKKTYDDKVFSESLKQQVDSGRRLSENQVKYLDRLVIKYGEQIENYQQLAEEWGFNSEAEESPEVGKLLEHMGKINQWNEPVTKGKRVWDDKKFFDSLARQYAQKKSLSARQVASLKKMAKKYKEKIPEYTQISSELGIE